MAETNSSQNDNDEIESRLDLLLFSAQQNILIEVDVFDEENRTILSSHR